MANRFVSATIVVSDLRESEAAYSDYLGYTLTHKGVITAQEAAFWDAPGIDGAPYALMAAQSGKGGVLRLIESKAYPDYKGLTSYGWNAVELLANDPMALADKLEDSPFNVIGPPRELTAGDSILAMQARGPSGEVLYMTRLGTPEYQKSYGVAESFVDRPFILVVAGPSHAALEAFYGATLGREIISFGTSTIDVVSDGLGKPADTLYPLSVARLDGVSLELDGYPEGTPERPCAEGMIPAGIAMISITADDLDALDLPWRTPPQALPGPHYGGRRAAIAIGPAGEWLEFVETSAEGA